MQCLRLALAGVVAILVVILLPANRTQLAPEVACAQIGCSTPTPYPPKSRSQVGNPDVYYGTNTQSYAPAIQTATVDFESHTDTNPVYRGAAYTSTWLNQGCFEHTILYYAANWGSQVPEARTLYRQLAPGQGKCNEYNWTNCNELVTGSWSGKCQEGQSSQYIKIIINKAHPRVVVGGQGNLVQNTVTHEMGHAFGLGHLQTTLPWCCSPSSVMHIDPCVSIYGVHPDYLQELDISFINALY